ncbi:MAG: hypothetical protein ABW076_00015 [Candidatus Thiodiazotropha sp.]
MMKSNRWLYYISKFTLLDELLGFVYWALAIYGIFLLAGQLDSTLSMVAVIAPYIVIVTLFYLFIIKKIKSFFKDDSR